MTLVMAIAILGSLALTPLAKALAWRSGAISHPDGNRRLHARPTPLWGGSAVYLAAFLGILAAHRLVRGTYNTVMLLVALGISAGMLCLLGCYDDRYDMRATWKLLGQIIAALPVVMAGCYVEGISLFGHGVPLGGFGFLFALGWLVLGINALNLLDGMDGLASVIGITISAAAALIARHHGQVEEMQLALALAGALAGFLVYNLPPARIYLGDCGSMVIGLAVSLLALRVSFVAPRTADLTVATALLFVPLMDTGLAIVRRSLKGQGLMVADRGHVHHRLLDRGLSVWGVLGLLSGFSMASGALAWAVAVWGRELWAWAALGVLMIMLVNRRLIGHQEWAMARRLVARAALRLARRALPSKAADRLASLSFATSNGPSEETAGRGIPATATPGVLPETGADAEEVKRAA